jgi:anti-sigma factor RsiW
MKCEDVILLLRDYADCELYSVDVERVGGHIIECAACAERLEAERDLKRVIQSKARVGPAPAGLGAEIKRAVRAQAGFSRNFTSVSPRIPGRRRFIAAGTAACLTLLVLGGIWFGSSRLQSPDPNRPTSRLIAELVDDHIRYLTAEGATQIETDDPADAERWFVDRIDIAVNLPRFTEPSMVLRGGRLCYILERRVALLFYDRGGERLSLFVMNPSGFTEPDRGRVNSNERRFVADSRKGYKTLCWERSGVVFALVGREELEALVKSADY